MFVADWDDIKGGKLTDVYFLRAKKILQAKKISKKVVVEFIVKSLPQDCNWGVFSGLNECINILTGIKGLNLWAVSEGTVFGVDEPVMVMEGRYEDFGVYETALLGFLCHASGIATKAARCKLSAGKKPVYSFGARRIYPPIAPMVERNAYLGGCDGVACVKSAEYLGIEPIGTIPHALILLMGDPVEAARAFDEVIEPKIKRIALIDTFGDEKFEAINVAVGLKGKLFGVRLDTPASRRGDFKKILKEVRWELDIRGFKDIKLIASGGIDEYKIKELAPYVDAFGVGTSISNAPVLDFAMDIVEIEGEPISKRGKLSGRKKLVRCPNCWRREILYYKDSIPVCCDCNIEMEEILQPWIADGEVVNKLPDINKSREYVLRQLEVISQL